MTGLRVALMSGALALAARGAAADGTAAPAPRVAIVPSVVVNLDPARADALGQELATALAAELQVTTIGGLEVRRALPPDGAPADCVSSPACIADVARRTGASQLLFLVLVDTGANGAIQIDSTWVDAATGHAIARPAIDIAVVAEARARFAASAHDLLPDAAPRPKARQAVDIQVHTAGGAPRHVTTPALVSAGVALVGLGVGGGFGLATRSKYNTCADAPGACTQGDRDGIRHLGLAADAGWTLAIGGALAASIWFATSGEEPHFVVAPTDGGAAATAVGRF